jgi:hypothetical protein
MKPLVATVLHSTDVLYVTNKSSHPELVTYQIENQI